MKGGHPNGGSAGAEQQTTPETFRVDVKSLQEANERLILAVARAQNLEEDRLDYFGLVLANVKEAIVATDRRHRLTAWNTAAERMYGWKPEEVIGLAQEEVTGARPCAPGVGWEQVHKSKDGRHMHVEGTTVPLLDERKKVQGYLSLIYDVTAQKDLEVEREARVQELSDLSERLVASERVKSEFVATMTHELRTPLNAILGFTHLALELPPGVDPSAQTRTYLGMVLTAGEHLLGLVDDILELSRIEAGTARIRRQTFELGSLIATAVERIEPEVSQKGLTVAAIRGPALEVRTDRGRLLQVLTKLLQNAEKFSETGCIEVRFQRAEGLVEITISDNGVGITQADRALVFESFRQGDSSLTRRYDGIGLGLHLSRRILGLLGGALHVKSESGEGSTFTVVLPATICVGT